MGGRRFNVKWPPPLPAVPHHAYNFPIPHQTLWSIHPHWNHAGWLAITIDNTCLYEKPIINITNSHPISLTLIATNILLMQILNLQKNGNFTKFQYGRLS